MKINFYRINLIRAFSCLAISLFLVPTSTFAQDTTWFTDVTNHVGLNIATPGAFIALDVNNDDYPDLLFLTGSQNDNGWALYLNKQNPNDPTNKFDRIFVDVTANSGLNVPNVYKDLAGAGDFDNDGNIDIVVNCWWFNLNENTCTANPDSGKSRLRIFWGNGDGTFTLDTNKNNGLEALGPMSGTGLPSLDYDRDGLLDLFVGCHYDSWCTQNAEPAHLMHNNGNRTFTDMATAAGINVSQKDPAKPWLNPPAARALFGANMADWNNDCWPDIFTCPYEAVGYPYEAVNHQYPTNADTEDTRGYGNLYKNNGDGTFTDVGITANWDPHFAWSIQGMVPWAAMPADYNNDGNLDYLGVLVHGTNYDTVPPYNTPTAFPGDGRTAIFTNLGPSQGYKLHPDVGQIRRNNPQNITHGDHNGFWIDFNNDGWQDLVIGDAAYDESTYGGQNCVPNDTPSCYPDYQRMFFELQDTTKHVFNDITQQLGYISGNTIQHKIRRPSVMMPVDFDLDGDDDIIKCPYNAGEDSVLVLRNNIGNKNNHITVKLVAPQGVNKSCIGARVTVKAGGKKQMREIYGDQGSWTNQSPFILNFGLGKSALIDSIDVRWPDANCTHTVVTNVQPNQFITINQSGYTAVHSVTPPVSYSFELYPNPNSSSILNVSLNSQAKSLIDIYNSIGQKISSFEFDNISNILQIPIQNLAPGMYWLHVNSGAINGTKSFVKVTNQ